MTTAPILIRLPDVQASRDNIEQRPDSQQQPTEASPDENTAADLPETTKASPSKQPPQQQGQAPRSSRASARWASAAWPVLVGGLLIALFIVSYMAITNGRQKKDAADRPDFSANDLSQDELHHAPHLAVNDDAPVLHATDDFRSVKPSDLRDAPPTDQDAIQLEGPSSFPSSPDHGASEAEPHIDMPFSGTWNTAPSDAPLGTAPSGTAPSGTAPSGTAPSGTAPLGTAPLGTARSSYTYPVTDPATYMYPDSSAPTDNSVIHTGQRQPAPTDGAYRQGREYRPSRVASLRGTIEPPPIGTRR